jgi:serine/threonine-protein kinase HipA
MTANRRAGNVYVKGELAGIVWQDEEGYGFQYNENYLERAGAAPVSLTLPFTDRPHLSPTMLPFFDGLIPEGWLLNLTVKNWKLDPRDRMGLLLTACKDCIGAVSVEPILTND